MDNNKVQLILSGFLGDGGLRSNGAIYFSCKSQEYMKFKSNLHEDMSDVKWKLNKGYKEGDIYYTIMGVSNEGKMIVENPFECLHLLDELGLAMWLYDDGSLHKDKHFFNINSHAFDKETQEKYFIPLLNKFNIFPRMISETKKDGRKFWYMTIPKYQGVFEISKILSKYKVEYYNYKILKIKNIEKYDIIKKKFKDFKVHPRSLGSIMNAETEDFNAYLNENIYNLKNGFISNNKWAKPEENSSTIYL